jgi:hypothetical protein
MEALFELFLVERSAAKKASAESLTRRVTPKIKQKKEVAMDTTSLQTN